MFEKEAEAAQHGKESKRLKELGRDIGNTRNKLATEIEAWETKKAKITPEVTHESIAEVISKLTGIPVTELTQAEKEKLLKLETRIRERLINQAEAVKSVADAIRRGRAGLGDPKRPIASFLFLGPTGVGKTELARTIAHILFGSEDTLVRIDMSEYMEKHNVSRLIGAPPGYVGYDEGGQLTEMVRRRPHAIILLDEIEKAHADVFNLLLQILEDGRLTDGKGRVVNFANTIIIATSNSGSDKIHKEMDKPESDRMNYESLKDSLIYNLRTVFRPEFLNRIDEIVVFKVLEKPELEQIVNLQLEKVRDKLETVGLKLEVTKAAVEALVDEGYDPHFGARELRRIIQKNVENAVSQAVLEREPERNSTIVVDFGKEKGFTVSIRKVRVGRA
jgi:ATP-dependent Clp protease ATP-binding subunit ClpC